MPNLVRYGQYRNEEDKVGDALDVFYKRTNIHFPSNILKVQLSNINDFVDLKKYTEEDLKKQNKDFDNYVIGKYQTIYAYYLNQIIAEQIDKASNPKRIKYDTNDKVIPYKEPNGNKIAIAELSTMFNSLFELFYGDFICEETKEELRNKKTSLSNLFKPNIDMFNLMKKTYTIADDKKWEMQRNNKYTSKNLMNDLKATNNKITTDILNNISSSEAQKFLVDYLCLKDQYKKRNVFERFFASRESRNEIERAENMIKSIIDSNPELKGKDPLEFARDSIKSTKTLSDLVSSADPDLYTESNEYSKKIGTYDKNLKKINAERVKNGLGEFEREKSPEEIKAEKEKIIEDYVKTFEADKNFRPDDLSKDEIELFNKAVKKYNDKYDQQIIKFKNNQLEELKNKAIETFKEKVKNEEEIAKYIKKVNGLTSRNSVVSLININKPKSIDPSKLNDEILKIKKDRIELYNSKSRINNVKIKDGLIDIPDSSFETKDEKYNKMIEIASKKSLSKEEIQKIEDLENEMDNLKIDNFTK